MRSELLSYLTTATSTATIKTVSELPWNTAGEPLYLKNLKKFYLDEEQVEQSVLIPCLPGFDDIMQNTITVNGYFACDAKNAPSGLSSSLNTILDAKNRIGVSNFGLQSSFTTEIQGDVIIYTIQYQMNTTA